MPIETEAAIAALDAMTSRVRSATVKAVVDSAVVVQRLAVINAPVVDGELRRSIKITGPQVAGRDRWAAYVGPTVVYGRQRELGGHLYPKRVAWMRWLDTAWKYPPLHRFPKSPDWAYSQHVYQKPEPYLKPAVEQALPMIRQRFANRVSAAMRG